MQWDLEGMQVSGLYLGEIPVEGHVTLSRVAYGGDVVHTVKLNSPIKVYGAIRECVKLDHKFVSKVADKNSIQ